MMTTIEISKRLKELCSKGDYEEAQKELYADTAISIEPMATPMFAKQTVGLENILDKGRKFESMVEEMHLTALSEPLIAGNTIAFTLTMDVTMKGRPRETMTELCVYKVKDGKIVSEEFFM